MENEENKNIKADKVQQKEQYKNKRFWQYFWGTIIILAIIFIRLNTATIIIAARVALGRLYNKSVKNNIVIKTTSHATTEARPVLAQLLKFTAVLEKLQATQKPQNNQELILANH